MKKMILFAAIYLAAQGTLFAQEASYVDYSAYVQTIAGFVQKGDTAAWSNSLRLLHASTRSLKEETVVQLPAARTPSRPKALTDEAIYAGRKGSVVIIGRLSRGEGADINFNVMGTGFFLTKEGHCVTNHHVLQQLLQTTPPEDDIVYFIITEDKKSYVINRLLTWSQNNDLAIFGIDAQGRQFDAIPLGKPAPVGASVYCISHPAGELYYFSKGMVARNVSRDSASLGTTYSPAGRTPVRMEISADYGGGSSGGPVMDRYGNLVGIVATTNTIYLHRPEPNGVTTAHPQMVMHSTIPVKVLTGLLR